MGGKLRGLKVLIPRPEEQALWLAEKVAELGGEPIVRPAIRIEPPKSYEALDKAIRSIESYDWLLFTSQNGVSSFVKRAEELGLRSLTTRCKVAVVGPATFYTATKHGLRVEFMPSIYLTKHLAEELPAEVGSKILLVRAEGVSDSMRSILSERGFIVNEVYAYRVEAACDVEVPEDINVVILTSPSIVRYLKDKLEGKGVIVICIGPTTARAAVSYGLRVDFVADEYTANGLLKKILEAVGVA